MAYKWKPSAAQRRAFAQRMQDPAEAAAYAQRKQDKADKRRVGSRFDYASAGGEYVPTQAQHATAWQIMADHNATRKQKDAAGLVMSAYACNERTHHDNIHIVNDYYRSHATH